MASPIIKLRVGNVVMKNPAKLRKKILDKGAEIIDRRIRGVERKMTEIASNLIYKSLYRSNVISALLGANNGDTGGDDLPAEFGLTASEARAGADAIVEYMSNPSNMLARTNPEVSPRAANTRLNLTLTYLPRTYRADLASLPEGHHPSKVDGSGEDIPWISWMVYNPSSQVVIPDYAIIYGVDGGLVNRSRSGEALMVPEMFDVTRRGKGFSKITTNEKNPLLDIYENRFPWTLPKIVIPVRSSNWITDIILDPGFKTRMINTIVNTIKSYVKRK